METLVKSPPGNLTNQHAFRESIEDIKLTSSIPHIDQTRKNDENEPQLESDDNQNNSSQLYSSPIKHQPRPRVNENYLADSPFKKKSVAFSDDLLVSDIPSSPPQGTQPKKSILKPLSQAALNSPSPRPNKLKSDPFSPHSVAFWHSGSIVQVAPLSAKLAPLVDGCMHVLQNADFDRKFEVYATLNNICKTNPALTVVKLLTNKLEVRRGPVNSPRNKSLPSSQSYVDTIAKLAKRDVLAIEQALFGNASYQNDDPFSTRVANQALKLVNFILTTPELNQLLPVELAQFYYSHAASMIAKPDISKSLILPYILILKDCRFSAHRKLMVFDSDTPDMIFQGLLKMKNFKSSSLVVERLIAFKNLLLNYPHTFAMPGNITPWLEQLILTVCDLSSPIYSKYASIGIMTMLEAARSFLTYKNVVPSIRKLLSSNVSQTITTFASNTIAFEQELSILDHVINSLNDLCAVGEFRLANDLWVSLILLTCNNDRFYEKTVYFTKLISAHELFLNPDDPGIKSMAITSWNAVTYSLCQECYKPVKGSKSPSKEKYDPTTNATKMAVLLRPFEDLSSSNDLGRTTLLHNLHLGILYTLGNSIEELSINLSQNLWRLVIHKVVSNMYYSHASNSGTQQMGQRLLKRLLNLNATVTLKPMSDMRCLSTEPVNLLEIRPLSRQVLHSSADMVFATLEVICGVSSMQALELMSLTLESIKPLLRKEVRTTNATKAYLRNLLAATSNFLRHEPLYLFVTKLVRILTLNFDIKLLKSIDHNDGQVNIFRHIISLCEEMLSHEDAAALIDYITQYVGDDVIQTEQEAEEALEEATEEMMDEENAVQDEVNTEANKSISEIVLLSEMLKNRQEDCENLVQKWADTIASLPIDSQEQAFKDSNVSSWTIIAFKQYLTLTKQSKAPVFEAPIPSLICQKWEDDNVFLDLAQYLIQNQFVAELYHVRENLLAKSAILNGFLLFDFKQKVKSLLNQILDSGDHAMLDGFLATCYNHKYDVKPYIKNRWNQLPTLKELWLRDNKELYIETPSSHTPVKEEVNKSLPAMMTRAQRKSKTPEHKVWSHCEISSDSSSVVSSPLVSETPDEPAPEVAQQTPTRTLKREAERTTRSSERKRVKTPPPAPVERPESLQESISTGKLDELELKLVEFSSHIGGIDAARKYQLESKLIDLLHSLRSG